jgi:N-acetylmuramoyl-L-alanine amidase
MALTRDGKRFLLLILFFMTVSVCLPPAAQLPKENADEADKAFENAVQKRKELNETEKAVLGQWIVCAQAFRQVYTINPNYRYAGDAVYEEGLLYQQIGDIFGGAGYYRTSVARFQLLLSNYGDNIHCPDALKRLIKMYSSLGNETAAKEADKILRERYLQETESVSAPKPTVPPKSEPQEKPELQPKNAPVKIAAATTTAGPILIKDISCESGDGVTRASITLGGNAGYEYDRIASPDRIYFDITNAILPEKYRNKTIPFNDSYIYRFRTSQGDDNTVRIVFDLASAGEHTIRVLSDPFRIIMEVRHSDEKAVKPERTPEGAPAINTPAKPVAGTSSVSPKPAADTSSASPKPAASKTADETKTAAAEPVKSETSKPSPTVSATKRDDRTLTRMLGLKIGRIVLDPGHGGDDLGAVGRGGMYEKDLVLEIARELRTLLKEEMGVEVIMTRDEDISVPLERRTEIANENRADLFISIHANSSSARALSGVETYYLDFAKTRAEREVAARENALSSHTVSELDALVRKIVDTDRMAESRELATAIQKNLFSDTLKLIPSSSNRGVRTAPFVVLINANMPSVLTEVAFISNPKDETLLGKKDTRKAFARALYSGITDYVKTLGGSIAQNQTK